MKSHGLLGNNCFQTTNPTSPTSVEIHTSSEPPSEPLHIMSSPFYLWACLIKSCIEHHWWLMLNLSFMIRANFSYNQQQPSKTSTVINKPTTLSNSLLTLCYRHLTAHRYPAGLSTIRVHDKHQQDHKTQVKGINNRNISFIAYLDILQAFLHGTYVASYKRALARSIIPTSAINIYGQFYKSCGAFPDDQWISLPVAFN